MDKVTFGVLRMSMIILMSVARIGVWFIASPIVNIYVTGCNPAPRVRTGDDTEDAETAVREAEQPGAVYKPSAQPVNHRCRKTGI